MALVLNGENKLKNGLIKRKRVPFLDTSPVVDIKLALVLLPLWWVMGVEQIIWPLIFLWSSVKILIIKRYIVRVPSILLYMGCFLIAQIASALFIDNAFRLITFARNLMTYGTAYLIIFIVSNTVDNWKQVTELLKIIIYTITITAVIGLLGIINIFRPSFITILGVLLPDTITNTSYGAAIAYQSIGEINWFVGLGNYFRVNSFFLYPTMYASSLMLCIPIIFFLRMITNKNKTALSIILVIIFINLIYTTGRFAILGLIIGLLYLLLAYKLNISRALILSVIFLYLLIITLILMLINGFDMDSILTLFEKIVFARGAGSVGERGKVYNVTIQGILERPFFGWATERDIDGLLYPAGSHSYYLGILYKHGLVGFICFTMIYLSLWYNTRPLKYRAFSMTTNELRSASSLLSFGRWIIVAALINSVTDVLDLDMLVMVIMWLIFAILMTTRRIIITDMITTQKTNHIPSHLY